MKTNKFDVKPNQAHWGLCKTPEDFALMNSCQLYIRQIVVKKILRTSEKNRQYHLQQ